MSGQQNVEHIKHQVTCCKIDPDRQTFTDKNDARLQFLLSMANSFSEMNPRSIPDGMRKQMLTVDTSEALFLTLKGMVSVIQVLLEKGFPYVPPGQMQSDRIEGEFGIYRSAAGGNYYISIDQI